MRQHCAPLVILVVACAVALLPVSVAAAAEYVVDGKHAAASDQNPGTAEKPMKTISAAAAKAAPGDTVLVKAGSYPEAVTLRNSGAEGKPITLTAAPGERVLVRRDDRRCGITWAAGVGHLVIDGFEVHDAALVGNEGGIGSREKGGHHVTIQNCVLVRCGLVLMGQSHCTVRRSVQTGCKRNGVSVNGSSNCSVEECEIFGNGADGLVVTHGSDGCKVLRNYIHNHWYDSHPDALQIYRTVTNLTVEGNLLFNSGQGFMMQESDGGVFRNNILCGTRHSGILLGHRTTHNWTVEQNTIAYTAFKALVFSGKGTRIRNNIILTGADNKLIQQAGESPCEADYNLYWKPEGEVAYHVPKDQDAHSKFADPRFRSAPPLARQAVYYVDKWTDEKAPEKCSTSTFCVGKKGMAEQFQVGDRVELNFDGIVRTVTAVTDESVTFDPPLEKLHHYVWDVMVNWKDKREFVWNLTPAEDSPARGMGDKGQTVGSTIDMQAYMKGDFNGDGRRDLPPVPDAAGEQSPSN